MTATEDTLREQLYASFKNRALLYWHLFDALRRRIGEEQAMAVMEEAIYARGTEIGRRFARFGPDDLDGLRAAFLAFIPDGGAMFDPEVRRADAHGLDIKLRRCPLKDLYGQIVRSS